MAKKPASGMSGDSRSRNSESGGTMTLRMIPASRSKTAASNVPATAAASHGQQQPSAVNATGATSVASNVKSRSKSSAALANANISTIESASPSSTSSKTFTAETASAGSSSANLHHSGLQQLTRERKQQLRHQTRLQKKLADSADHDTGMDADIEANVDGKQNKANPRSRANSKSAAARAENLSQEARKVERDNLIHEIANNPQFATLVAPDADMTAQLGQQDGVSIVTVDNRVNAGQPPVQADQISDARVQNMHIADPAGTYPDQIANAGVGGAQNQGISLNCSNSALSFQSMTDSLFAQLNAKVSGATTPPNTVPGYSGIGVLNEHGAPGMRGAAGYPTSGVDPLLFAPSISNDKQLSDSSGGHVGGNGPLNALPSFSLFSGQQMPQWSSGIGAASGAYPQSSLNRLIGESNVIGAPMSGMLQEPSGSGGYGQNPVRPRSRWDFAHADEASAQAELQSVLGRGLGNGSAAFGQQQGHVGHGVGASLASSRDLGMFSTPVQNNYSGGPWGNMQASQQRQQDVGSGAMAPFMPPGFDRRQHHAENMRSEMRTLSPLASATASMVSMGAIGANAQGPTGPNTLLSRLMGGSSSAASPTNGMGSEALQGVIGYQDQNQNQHQHQHQHQHQQLPQLAFQDPMMAPPSQMMGANLTSASSWTQQQQHQQQQQQQQQGLGRTDSSVLNSLLSRLQVGRDADAAMRTGVGATAAPQQLGMMTSGTFAAPPGIMPLNPGVGMTAP
ncbi:hypothetical protein H4S06_004584, partial [Coemansia sp. BCRC 34490]